MTPTLKRTLVASICGLSLSVPFFAGAEGTTDKTKEPINRSATAPNTQADPLVYRDRLNMDRMEQQRAELVRALPPGQKADFYKKKLSELGYRVTAVNDAEEDYLEYEVVKGRDSHEVQIDLDGKGRTAESVDIAPNMWRADATEAALRGETVKSQTTSDSSDRRYVQAWNDQKDALEKALPAGQDRKFYESKLREMGYKITAVNEADKDDVEYEIAKGRNSYEVQIELDASSGKAEEVDVTTNLWKADETEAEVDMAKKQR